MATCFICATTKRVENIEMTLIKNIKLENVQNEIFMHFISHVAPDTVFLKTEFIRYLTNYIYDQMLPKNNRHYQIQEEVIHNMADIILLRAQEQEVIRKIKANSLIDSFEIIINQENE